MIDISEKDTILRIAKASGRIKLKQETLARIKHGQVKKGDVFTIAKVAAINAVKKVPELIPFCHQIPITNVIVDFGIENSTIIKCTITVKSIAQTGVEMEALTGVNIALLNIWDVVKMYEKDESGQYPSTKIFDIKVEKKIKK
ncbi:MAG: cyclic pyranopterin monophosphate synthase MoaC [Candidatus Hodarchaeales archaeon]|jgi:cyclic pyranopterin phosphate synthase